MKAEIITQYLEKKVPLTISRETKKGDFNTFLQITCDENTGIGETIFEGDLKAQTEQLVDFLSQQSNYSPVAMWDIAMSAGLNARQIALIDLSLWDLLAQQARMPLYQLLGLNNRAIDTSLTISIGEKDWVYQRTQQLIQDYAPSLIKIKLGSKQGIEHDKESFIAVSEAIKKTAKKPVSVFVDANGGWNLKKAKQMLTWLADKNVDYVEQPLAVVDNAQLGELYKNRPLPIYIDESCNFTSDLKTLHSVVDGVNIKLLKCGGITEALRIIHTARAFDLKVMLGCFGESPVSITGAASLASLVDYVDLDSFLNLKMEDLPQVKFDLKYDEGKLSVSNTQGLGVTYE